MADMKIVFPALSDLYKKKSFSTFKFKLFGFLESIEILV